MRIVVIFALLLLATCAASSTSIRENLISRFSAKGYKEHVYNTSYFKIFSLEKITDPSLPIRIYIEGDGRAYLNKSMASSDPTPIHQTLLELVEEDDYPNIIYLARPCQYGLGDEKCTDKYWTLGRFAPQVVNSNNEIIEQLSDKKLELVGYSGGGEIAVFIASSNPNVVSLRTIAGNIDHEAFTTFHDTTPLYDSVDPSFDIKKISFLPQVHFVGSNDDVVPKQIGEAYRQKQKPNNCTKFITVKGATHSDGWKDQWPQLLKVKPECTG